MFRTVLPSLSNTFISLFKDTSLAAAIAVPELTFAAREISTNTFRVIEAWTTAGALYIATCFLIAGVLRFSSGEFAGRSTRAMQTVVDNFGLLMRAKEHPAASAVIIAIGTGSGCSAALGCSTVLSRCGPSCGGTSISFAVPRCWW